MKITDGVAEFVRNIPTVEGDSVKDFTQTILTMYGRAMNDVMRQTYDDDKVKPYQDLIARTFHTADTIFQQCSPDNINSIADVKEHLSVSDAIDEVIIYLDAAFRKAGMMNTAEEMELVRGMTIHFMCHKIQVDVVSEAVMFSLSRYTEEAQRVNEFMGLLSMLTDNEDLLNFNEFVFKGFQDKVNAIYKLMERYEVHILQSEDTSIEYVGYNDVLNLCDAFTERLGGGSIGAA